jgi:hypothetical protein
MMPPRQRAQVLTHLHYPLLSSTASADTIPMQRSTKKCLLNNRSIVRVRDTAHLLLPQDHTIQELLQGIPEVLYSFLLESCNLRFYKFRHLLEFKFRFGCSSFGLKNPYLSGGEKER